MRSAASFLIRILFALSLVVGTAPAGGEGLHAVYGCASEIAVGYGKSSDEACACKVKAAPFAKTKSSKAAGARGKGKTFLSLSVPGGISVPSLFSEAACAPPMPVPDFGISHLPYLGRSPPVPV
ncbi:hypothetical protein EON81_00010 [bacterium]|nr:MAG: hypothetical protein EON81_00010 [bacterium]